MEDPKYLGFPFNVSATAALAELLVGLGTGYDGDLQNTDLLFPKCAIILTFWLQLTGSRNQL